jgi:hypothetical protein
MMENTKLKYHKFEINAMIFIKSIKNSKIPYNKNKQEAHLDLNYIIV